MFVPGALALCMQTAAVLEPPRRHALNLRVVAAFFASHALVTLVFFRFEPLAVGFFR